MKKVYSCLKLAGFGLALGACSSSAREKPDAASPDSVPAYPTSRPNEKRLAGLLLPALTQRLRASQGGHVLAVDFSPGQTVRAGDVLLKIGTGPWSAMRKLYLTAPFSGEVTGLNISTGDYLAADSTYALLSQSVPVRVRMPAQAAATLHPGDTLRLLAGPPGLAGAQPVITAIMPPDAAAPAGSVVLVLGGLRWPHALATRVAVAPLHAAPPRHLTRE